ncbi:C39 family peptidase [Pseudoneobacillus sp. C159]
MFLTIGITALFGATVLFLGFYWDYLPFPTSQPTIEPVKVATSRDTAPEQPFSTVASKPIEAQMPEPPLPKPIKLPEKIVLDVPLLKQMDAPRLYNGCEVTSLAMLLNFHGVDVTKNELADKIKRVPLKYKDGKYGNPNVGFVGNMEDGPGLGVYHGPIFQLAKAYVGKRAEDLTHQSFYSLIKSVAQGEPVWVITTSSFSQVAPLQTWKTPQGPVGVTFKMHSVVMTGYDKDHIYINDPYGGKNKKVNRNNFVKAWEQMGSQAIVFHKE